MSALGSHSDKFDGGCGHVQGLGGGNRPQCFFFVIKWDIWRFFLGSNIVKRYQPTLLKLTAPSMASITILTIDYEAFLLFKASSQFMVEGIGNPNSLFI